MAIFNSHKSIFGQNDHCKIDISDFLESGETIYECYTIVDNNSLDADAEQNPVIFLRFEESEDENDLNVPVKNEVDDLSGLNIISTLDDKEIFIENTPVKGNEYSTRLILIV